MRGVFLVAVFAGCAAPSMPAPAPTLDELDRRFAAVKRIHAEWIAKPPEMSDVRIILDADFEASRLDVHFGLRRFSVSPTLLEVQAGGERYHADMGRLLSTTTGIEDRLHTAIDAMLREPPRSEARPPWGLRLMVRARGKKTADETGDFRMGFAFRRGPPSVNWLHSARLTGAAPRRTPDGIALDVDGVTYGLDERTGFLKFLDLDYLGARHRFLHPVSMTESAPWPDAPDPKAFRKTIPVTHPAFVQFLDLSTMLTDALRRVVLAWDRVAEAELEAVLVDAAVEWQGYARDDLITWYATEYLARAKSDGSSTADLKEQFDALAPRFTQAILGVEQTIRRNLAASLQPFIEAGADACAGVDNSEPFRRLVERAFRFDRVEEARRKTERAPGEFLRDAIRKLE